MSHFLGRLVERARGTAAVVEPLVTLRFAPTPMVEIASEVEAPPPERRDQQPTVEKKSSPRAVRQQEVQAENAEPNVIRGSEKSSPREQPAKLLVPVETGAMDSMVFVTPLPSADQPVPAVKNGMVRRNSFTPSRSKRPRPPTPLTTTSWNFDHDLLTPNESSQQPPSVRITIGRIDVRATPPATPSRKSSARSEPKLTLDAYLKSRREGRR